MSEKRTLYLEKIGLERERQTNLFGSEWDLKNTPDKWMGKISQIALSNIQTGTRKPNSDEFEEKMIQTAATALAALEYIESMKSKNFLD